MDDEPALDLREGVTPTPEVAEHPEADGWAEVFAAIRKAGELEDDWDGQGAPAIPSEAVRTAADLADELRINGWVPPNDFGADVDGAVSLAWHFPDRHASIEVGAGGRVRAIHWATGDHRGEYFDPVSSAPPPQGRNDPGIRSDRP